MLNPENVATPAEAATVAVPASVPLPGFVPIATVTFPVNPVAVFPCASCAVTWTAGVMLAPATALVGWTVKTSFAAADGFTTTVAVCVTSTPLIRADTIFDSATVELRLPVATPLAFVVVPGCVTVFPNPLALSTTVAPATGLPRASRAVTVIVDDPLPAVMGDVAATLDYPRRRCWPRRRPSPSV